MPFWSCSNPCIQNNFLLPEFLRCAKLSAIATLFGVTVDFLLSGESSEKPVSVLNNVKILYDDGAVELLETYEQLNAAGRKKAVDNIKDLSEIDKYKK